MPRPRRASSRYGGYQNAETSSTTSGQHKKAGRRISWAAVSSAVFRSRAFRTAGWPCPSVVPASISAAS